jgi:hypothetical protein
MHRLFRLCYAFFAVVGFTAWPLYPQSAAISPEVNSIASQQQSVALQMDGIAVKSAQTQADSIRLQASSIRQQYGTSAEGTEQSTLEASADNLSRGTVDPLTAPPIKFAAGPSTKLGAAPPQRATVSAGENPQPAEPQQVHPDDRRSNGFFTVPWHAPDDFIMPSVQVETNDCDALGGDHVDRLVKEASGKYKLDPTLLRAVMRQESGLRPCAISTAGAMGLMQIMPETADDLGLADPFEPSANVDAGAHYLKQMLERYNGNRALALAAYNAGPGRTDKANGIPPISETIGYISNILSSIPLF